MFSFFAYLLVFLLSLYILLKCTGLPFLNALLGFLSGRSLRISAVGWFKVYGIEIALRGGISVHIQFLKITFFPTNYSKPLLLFVHDVRVEGAHKGVEEEEAVVVEERTSRRSSSPSFETLLQYVAVSLDSVHVIWLDSRFGTLLHFTVDDARLEVFRGPRSWQGECGSRLIQGKVLERTSPSPPLAEFSLAASVSIDSSLDTVNVTLEDPSFSLSHRALELCATLDLATIFARRKTDKSSPQPVAERSSWKIFPKVDVILTSFILRYSAVVEGTSRQLVLSTGRCCVSTRGESFSVVGADCAMEESGKRFSARTASVSLSAARSEGRWEVRVWTGGISLVLPVGDCLGWRAHASSFLRPRLWNGREEKASSLSLLMEISHVDSSIISLDGKQWTLVCKLFHLTKTHSPASIEVAVDELWVNSRGRPPRTGVHEWGDLLCIGTAILQVEMEGPSIRVIAAADNCKAEWSDELLTQLKQLQSQREGIPPTEGRRALTVEATIKNAVLIVNARGATAMAASVQQLTVKASPSSRSFSAAELRVVTAPLKKEGMILDEIFMAKKTVMTPWKEEGACRSWKQKVDDEKRKNSRKETFAQRTYALNAYATSLDVRVDGGNVKVEANSSLFIAWSPLLHTLALHVARTTASAFSPSSTPSSPSSPSSPFSINVVAKESVQVDLELEDFHLMSWTSPVMQLEVKKDGEIILLSPTPEVSFDGFSILSLKDVVINRRLSDLAMDSSRAATEGLVTPSNKVWSWTAESLRFLLPFDFNFAAAWDELITVVKWIGVMGGKRAGRPSDPPLPADFHLLVQEATFEMEDDPFERRLQNSHELREDEVFERERRRQTLVDKISSLTKNGTFLSQAKIEELYASLLEKNSSIFVHRYKQLGENTTPLFKSSWRRLEIRAMADESMRRDEECTVLLQKLDPVASLPEGVEWTTLWGRQVQVSVEEWVLQLRDYPLPYGVTRNLYMFGEVVAAERLSHGGRSLREKTVQLPPPWLSIPIRRNINPLKFFYDMQAECDDFVVNYGPCWEPALAMTSLQWNNISTPSRDPSPLLPFWDKMRFLLHGRLLWSSRRVVTSMLASLDPYNSSESLEWEWTEWGLEWTHGEIKVSSSLDVRLRTASRYDNVCLLSLPHQNLRVLTKWICRGEAYDHHAVELCTDANLPHSALSHDSYRSFRSDGVDVSLDLIVHGEEGKEPKILLYANCVRCLDLLLKTISRLNGNTRRGPVFGIPPFHKKQFTKHFQNAQIQIRLPQFQIQYMMSKSSEEGLRLTCEQFGLSAVLKQTLLAPHDEKLRRRRLYRWKLDLISTTLGETQLVVLGAETPPSPGKLPPSLRPLLSFTQVSLTVDAHGPIQEAQRKVDVNDLRLSWTAAQRDIFLAIAEGARRAQLVRSMLAHHHRNIEEREEKEEKKEKGKKRSHERREEEEDNDDKTDLLERLIEEAETKKVAHCEHSMEIHADALQGISQATQDDVLSTQWNIELHNSQMMLVGEGGRFVIVAASKAILTQKIHRPVWKTAQLLGKKSWSAHLHGMQYFAPISKSSAEGGETNWLPKEVIEEKAFGGDISLDRVSSLIETGGAVGGVVDTEKSIAAAPSTQLQRIISKCSCQIYWVSFNEDVDESLLGEAAEGEVAEDLAVDCITLKHNLLAASTNAEQYSLAVDLVNQLVLFVDPRKKEREELRNRRLFECRLQSVEEMTATVATQQNKLREVFCMVKSFERQIFHLDGGDGNEEEREKRKNAIVKDMDEHKNMQLDAAEHMAITISVLKQRQVEATRSFSRSSTEEWEVPVVRKFEVCFEDCTWNLTEADGQLAVAHFQIMNFLYTRTMRVDNGGEHLFELGTVRVKNLLPDTPFSDTVDRDSRYPSSDAAIRVICREMAPVGAIPVKEHFEVNIAPMVVQLTFRFFDSMMTFFFPERNKHKEVNLDTEESEKPQRRLSLTRRITGGLSMVRSSGRGQSSAVAIDDIDKMRQRADSNNFFLYIKIPEVPFLVSYKGSKEKNIEDVSNASLIFPLCEYHEKNWTWLDLSIAVKQRCRRVLVQQYMKQKLLRNKNKGEQPLPTDEDKRRIAIGHTSILMEKRKK